MNKKPKTEPKFRFICMGRHVEGATELYGADIDFESESFVPPPEEDVSDDSDSGDD